MMPSSGTELQCSVAWSHDYSEADIQEAQQESGQSEVRIMSAGKENPNHRKNKLNCKLANTDGQIKTNASCT